MNTQRRVPGVADAVGSAPSAGEALRFAAYVADLIGADRVGDVAWSTEDRMLFVRLTDPHHGETVARLLGLGRRWDHEPIEEDPEGFSCWTGKSGNVPVFLTAPVATAVT